MIEGISEKLDEGKVDGDNEFGFEEVTETGKEEVIEHEEEDDFVQHESIEFW